MSKTNQSLTVYYEVSTGTHNFYCVSFRHEIGGTPELQVPLVVLEQCVNKSSQYAGVYEEPTEWFIVGAVDIRKLPAPKGIEVRK